MCNLWIYKYLSYMLDITYNVCYNYIQNEFKNNGK